MDITAAKSLQSCPTLCDPIDRSPPGSPVPGILQARTLEWVVTSFSNARKWKVKGKSSLSRVQLLATPWTTAYQAPLSTRFSRQEYWSGSPVLTYIQFLQHMDYSPPGSSVPGMLQARILVWVVISFSRESSRSRDQTQVSCASSSLLHCRRILYKWAIRETPT